MLWNGVSFYSSNARNSAFLLKSVLLVWNALSCTVAGCMILTLWHQLGIGNNILFILMICFWLLLLISSCEAKVNCSRWSSLAGFLNRWNLRLVAYKEGSDFFSLTLRKVFDDFESARREGIMLWYDGWFRSIIVPQLPSFLITSSWGFYA